VAFGAALSSAPANAAATPSCTFNGSTLPIVTGVTAGTKVQLDCTGLQPLHPYLLMEISLVIGIDPAASGLLSGNVASLSGLESALSALGLLNAGSLAFPFSDLNGNLTTTYTVPSSEAADPNASCPPTPVEYNSGLLGCALAMVDLTTFKAVGAGSGVLEYLGDPFLPPDPQVVITPTKTTPGGTETVSSPPGASTYWWLSTLASLESLLGGSGGGDTVRVSIGKNFVPATNDITITPASYKSGVLDSPGTLTPPSISGTFTVPGGVKGKQKVTVIDAATLSGLPLSISASQRITIKKH
jgi:hypothetical protein